MSIVLRLRNPQVEPQFSSVTQSCLTLHDPMGCSMPGLPIHHQLPELTHVHWVRDAIQPSHTLSSPSPSTFNLCQHQGLFKWVSSSYQVGEGNANPLQYSLAWKILWREEPGGLQSMGSQRVGHDWAAKLSLSYQVAKVLELQLHHQLFQWIFSIDFL